MRKTCFILSGWIHHSDISYMDYNKQGQKKNSNRSGFAYPSQNVRLQLPLVDLQNISSTTPVCHTASILTTERTP